jgi:hypothetical protein
MTRRASGEWRGAAAAPAAVRLRWLRIAAIAVAAVSLASCRGMPTSAVLGTAAVSHAIGGLIPGQPQHAAAEGELLADREMPHAEQQGSEVERRR